MVEVTIDSVRVSLMSQHRVVILKDVDSDRYLPIWIGACEADAITVTLQEMEVSRPLTHDLLKNVIVKMGGAGWKWWCRPRSRRLARARPPPLPPSPPRRRSR